MADQLTRDTETIRAATRRRRGSRRVEHPVGSSSRSALTRDAFEPALGDAGLTEVEIVETHRVHEHAASAIVRARKP